MPAYCLKHNFMKITPFCLLILLICGGIKYNYSIAAAPDLKWILTPTADVVERMSGINFEADGDTGYISREKGIVIASACAGVNFFIIAFGLSAFIGLYRLPEAGKRSVWIMLILPVSYGITVLVNAVRIVVSIRLYGADIYGPLITPERVHQAAGILIYLGGLYGYYFLVEKILSTAFTSTRAIDNSDISSHGFSSLLPIMVYLSITVVVPFLNDAAVLGKEQFMEHIALVSAGCLLVYGSILLIRLSYLKFRRKMRQHHDPLFSAAPKCGY